MAILTHGSDLSLAPTLTPVVQATGGTVRSALERVARMGFETVQLDAALRGIRPRELNRAGRRELLSTVRRRGLRIGGLELLIPRKHYLDAHHVDRAMSATLGAIELAADLDRAPVSLSLPVRRMPAELASTIAEAADGHGVPVAVHGEDQLEALQHWLEEVDLPVLGAAVDPAPLLSRGQDPAVVAQRLGGRLNVARLSDLERGMAEGSESDEGGGGETVRCVPGRGELDLMAYRVALDLASSRPGPVVLDLRGLSAPMRAATEAKRAWENAAISF